MVGTLIGYARCSIDEQDLTAQRNALESLGVKEDRIYLDQGLTGTNRRRPGLDQALAAVRTGDTLVVPKLDRLARSVPDARAIGDELAAKGVVLSLGGQVHDPTDPMGKNVLQHPCHLRRVRSRPPPHAHSRRDGSGSSEGQAQGPTTEALTETATGTLPNARSGDHSISDLAEVFAVSRPTVYRVLQRAAAIGQTAESASG